MPEIVLATLNAKFLHSAFGLRYLRANLGELRARSVIAEFDIHQRPLDIAEHLLGLGPRVLGLGVYIWNAAESTRLVHLLKRLQPELKIVLGGPEVSHETREQEIVKAADYVIRGEGDLAFAALCRRLLAGEHPEPRIIDAPLPDPAALTLPYEEYTDEDIAHRLVYVEASRGCPFTCEFCLSSLDVPVRAFPLDRFLAAMERLWERGVRHFKFVDRTFNLNVRTGAAILDFFLARIGPELFLHFEMIPDRLPTALRERIRRFPQGSLQFEVGLQTFNPEVAARIHRRQDDAVAAENLRFLREETGVHVHADLIAGLPGESLESFAAGFDRLVALGPQEIQVGLLKRLRGTPITRHDAEWAAVWSPLPPYELLQNRLLDFTTMQSLRRFARVWDLVANSGNFVETTPRLWTGSTPFAGFQRFSEWLFNRLGRGHGIALPRLARATFDYLTGPLGQAPAAAGAVLARDYRRPGRRDVPPFLQAWAEPRPRMKPASAARPPGAHRQGRHQPPGADDGADPSSDA